MMESPNLVANDVEPSIMLDMDGPPSSPFQSHVESRMISQQWESRTATVTEERTMDMFATPAKSVHRSSPIDIMEDKENMPQSENKTQKLASSTRNMSAPRPTTPERTPLPADDEGLAPATEKWRENKDSDLMPPPPSTRKTPKRAPLRPSESAANTPRARPTPSRGNDSNSLDRVETNWTQSSTFFQAGLDFRASQVSHAPTQDHSGLDDTCFSAFSEIPEMTVFAKLGQSPTKREEQTPRHSVRTPGRNVEATPRTSHKRPSPSRSPSPTPRRQKTPANHDGTTFLIDFTQQMDGVAGHAIKSPSKSNTQPDLLKYMNQQRSPHKNNRSSYTTPRKENAIMNLLDFELPPAPTPRSVPTITVRELESLKSSYLSQISSLKATLSGREAEVESLKRAVVDAERRVGEAQENLRDEKNKREWAEQEKAGWEKRGQEVENVLQSVKEEVMKGETEKEDLLRKMDECERRAENAEARAVKAEERFADALAARASSGEGEATDVEDQVQRLVAAQIDSKIEAVSRELHTVYKEKHERKVATLKKSYEARSEKKCADLQNRLSELERQNEDLLAAKDATFSGPVPGASQSKEQKEREAQLKAEVEEQRAYLARIESEMQASQQQQDQLMRELEQERIEKGDLVAAVDEMLALQAEQKSAAGDQSIVGDTSVVEDFRKSIKSISRPSGLRAPGGIPTSRMAQPTGLGRARTGTGGKSSILSNIERMGRAGGGAAPAEQDPVPKWF